MSIRNDFSAEGAILNKIDASVVRAAGYDALIKRFDLRVISHWHHSAVSTTRKQYERHEAGSVFEVYPVHYWPGETLGNHLEFALKYDGINLGILACIFEAMNIEEFVDYLKSRPTGQNARRLWFLYEWMTRKVLDLPDLKRGNYINMLDPEVHYVSEYVVQVKRQRVLNNLLGEDSFCPTARRTAALKAFEEKKLNVMCGQLIQQYPPELLKRALAYSYVKETRSSFEIEQEEPGLNKVESFVSLLHEAQAENFLAGWRLVELQNQIVEPKYKNTGYRTSQVYVGQNIPPYHQKVHFIGAKPADLHDLMEGLITCYLKHIEGNAPESPVVCAAIASYGIVFLHPFDDGNGRVHRFLIHNILSRLGFTPQGAIFPVSAAMLKRLDAYDASLEAFSKPLMKVTDWSLDDEGELTVHNDTKVWYRFMDLTTQAEALFGFIEHTLEHELKEGFTFLVHYDRTRRAMSEVLDMPNRKADLFIKLCLQNKGKLSQTKRESQFAELTDEEVARMEEAVWIGYEMNA